MSNYSWIKTALAYKGTKEIKGARDNPVVVALWALGKAGKVNDDETPWCAAWVSAVFELAGIRSARTGWARSYLNWGTKIQGPAPGCVVVFKRGSGGHVGFVVGKDKRGNLMVLGGNQGDAVNVKPFAKDRVLGYRWPPGEPLPDKTGMSTLEVVSTTDPVSTNEA